MHKLINNIIYLLFRTTTLRSQSPHIISECRYMLGVFIAVEAECKFQSEFCRQCNGKFVDKFTIQCCDDMAGSALAAFIRLSGFTCQFYDSITKLTEPQTKASVFMELRNIMRHRALVYMNLPNLFVAMDALKININYPLLVADKFRHI